MMTTEQPGIPTETQVAVAAHEAEIGPLVGIIVGSKADLEAVEAAETILRDAGVPLETSVMSAHRNPEIVAEYCKGARQRGIRVIIAAAGLAASLPGVAAAHTDLPVIGVPLTSRLTVAGGLDALLSIAQMPPGVPVATVGVDNSKNAAHLALRILSI
jgi:phosphoribosylaminoimidazole carboxylase PurE protein